MNRTRLVYSAKSSSSSRRDHTTTPSLRPHSAGTSSSEVVSPTRLSSKGQAFTHGNLVRAPTKPKIHRIFSSLQQQQHFAMFLAHLVVKLRDVCLSSVMHPSHRSLTMCSA